MGHSLLTILPYHPGLHIPRIYLSTLALIVMPPFGGWVVIRDDQDIESERPHKGLV